MHIRVNGETRSVTTPLSVAALLEELGLAGKRVAVEVNATIVPKSRQAEHQLADGDRVEIIQAIGGG